MTQAERITQKAEELAAIIHRDDMAPGPIGTTINFPGKTSDRIETALTDIAAEQREKDALAAECYQFPTGEVIPVPKSFKFDESKKFNVVDNMTKYGIAQAIRRGDDE